MTKIAIKERGGGGGGFLVSPLATLSMFHSVSCGLHLLWYKQKAVLSFTHNHNSHSLYSTHPKLTQSCHLNIHYVFTYFSFLFLSFYTSQRFEVHLQKSSAKEYSMFCSVIHMVFSLAEKQLGPVHIFGKDYSISNGPIFTTKNSAKVLQF